jgi:DNA-binding transcriptional ArsR family regulator
VSDEIPPIPDAWWASLAHRLLHPVQVEVIKALRQSGRPLSAREIAEVVENTSAARLAQHHLRRLRRLGAIDYTDGEEPRNRIDVRYRLVLDLPTNDR